MKFHNVLLIISMIIATTAMSQSEYQQAINHYKLEEFSKAKPIFQKYLKQHPNDSQTKEYLGDIAGYTKDWDTAIFYYEQLLAWDNSNANYHFKYGGALGMKALSISKIRAITYISDIRTAFEQATSLDPNHIEARWALVEFYIQLPGIIGGSESKAIVYANELGTISPVDGFLANGYIAEFSDRPNDAEKFYKRAIEVGGSPHSYEKLSNLYEKNNKPKEAIETSSKSLEIHQRNQLNYQIGKIAAQYDLDAELGIQCLQQYIKNHTIKDGVPKDWAYYRMAQIYRNEGKKQTALVWIEKALLDRPDFKEAMAEKERIIAL